MLPTSLLTAFAFLLGLATGSFLNVCIARLPVDESVVRPRSKCPGCGAPIRALDNIPVLSWLLLRGRCRACGQHISLQYPLVELLTGLWFAVLFVRYQAASVLLDAYLPAPWGQHAQLALQYIAIATLGWLLLGLMVMDWQTGLIPDEFTFGGMFAGIMLYLPWTFLLPDDTGRVMLTAPERAITLRLLAIAGAALVLLLVRWLYWMVRHSEGMGLGDVKMLAMIAAFLGLKLAMLSLFIGVVAGALFAIGLVMALRMKKVIPAPPDSPGVTTPTPLHPAHMHVPFGSFLAIGGMYAALYGPQTINWYMKFWR